MFETYASRLATLSPAEAALVAGALGRRRLIPPGVLDGGDGKVEPSELIRVLDGYSLLAADVVAVLLPEPGALAQNAIEKIFGRPITHLPAQSAPPPAPRHEGAQPPPPDTSLMGRRTIHNIRPNPKRPGTGANERFALYREGMTVAEYLAAGGHVRDISWDAKEKFIEVRDVEA